MATSVSNVLEALKYTYGVNRVLRFGNEESVAFRLFGKVKKPMGGRGQFIMPILTQEAGAWTGVAEGGAFPTALDPDTAEATFSLKEFVAVYSLSYKLIEDARNDKFAFQTALSLMDESIRRRIFRNVNSDLLGTSRGELFTISGVDSAGAIVTSYYLPRVQKGMVVDVVDASDDNTKIADSRTVEAVDPIARTVDLSGADLAGEAAGDYGVIQDTLTSTVDYHPYGLLAVIDDANPLAIAGNFGGINRSTAGNEYWKSVVLSNSAVNRTLTEDLMLQALDAVREKGGTEVTNWISNLAIIRRYHEMLAGERFFALSAPGAIGGGIGRKNQSPTSSEGETPYNFSGIPWNVEPYFTNNTIIGVDTKHFFLGVGSTDAPMPVSEVFDGVPHFTTTANTTFDVRWYWQYQLLSDNPAAGVKIEDVAES